MWIFFGCAVGCFFLNLQTDAVCSCSAQPYLLEEKIANLESENQVLCQQAVSMASNKFVSSRQRSMLQDLHSPSIYHRKGEVEEKPQKFLNEKQQENQELLIRCIALPLGFAGNRPIAACIIYKCLLHWRSFEVDRTSIFDRLIQTIGHGIETLPNLQEQEFH